MKLVRSSVPLIWILFLGIVDPDQRILAQEKSKLEIGDVQTTPLAEGTLLREWEVRGASVKELTVRLLVAKDGKSKVAQENVYRWDKPLPDVKTRLVYLHQDGQAFGAKDKRLPSFALRANGSELKPSLGKREKVFLEGTFGWSVGQDEAPRGSIHPGKQTIVSWELHGKAPKEIRAGSVDSLVAGTNEGRTAAILVLEWK